MGRPTIGVFISTTGDPRLATTLRSIASQRLEPGDRILIAADGPVTWDIGKLARRLGKQFEFVEREKRPSEEWGHGQSNISIEALKGTVDLVTAQDQDDIFAPRAFDAMRMRAEEHPNHLLMARTYNHAWGLLWRTKDWDEPLVADDDRYIGNMAIDGHCPWMPGREPLLPHFGLPYNGDQEYVQANRILFWNRTVWCDEITTITRPEQTLRSKLRATLLTTARQLEALRLIYNSGIEHMTGPGEPPTREDQLAWWQALDHGKNWLWLFEPLGHDVGYVGFLRMEDRDGEMWVTYGVLPEYRGLGFGKEMVRFSMLAAQTQTLRGLVKADNARAVKLYQKAGFELTPAKDGIIGMRWAGTPAFLKGMR